MDHVTGMFVDSLTSFARCAFGTGRIIVADFLQSKITHILHNITVQNLHKVKVHNCFWITILEWNCLPLQPSISCLLSPVSCLPSLRYSYCVSPHSHLDISCSPIKKVWNPIQTCVLLFVVQFSIFIATPICFWDPLYSCSHCVPLYSHCVPLHCYWKFLFTHSFPNAQNENILVFYYFTLVIYLFFGSSVCIIYQYAVF